ncbi:translation factor SUI1-like protein [Thalictrum thalictroides]|uniref:Translation factor SUI1-like protein n=1 Tax=Thalictrum thalictroides TaxID=46969 RepID=A0A7J6VH72_THATH|nr:translation factor SUI1-like protein [Thalictrum thalictroides]
MVELDFQVAAKIDPFAEAEDSGTGVQEYVHIRIQQRNGKKSLTTVQGLKADKVDEKKTKGVKTTTDKGNEKTEKGLKTVKVNEKADKAAGGGGYDKILKLCKKEFCCNGSVVEDKELGKVIQLQGDQRKNVANLLVKAGIVKKDFIKIHGF